MKKCGKCKKTKSLKNFYISNNKYNGWCKDCYKSWHLQRYKVNYTLDKKQCLFCNLVFEPKVRRKTFFCSRKCKDFFKKQELKEQRIESKQDRLCLHCAKIITRNRRSDAIFCSEKCNMAAHGLQRSLRNRANEQGKRGFLRLQICERDKWICQICNKKIDKNVEYPNLKVASLDHIIPVSKGGSSDISNLRLTHYICNISRGNRTL